MADQIFKASENEFTKQLSDADRKIQLIGQSHNKEDAIAEAKRYVENAEESFKQIEREFTKIPPNVQSQYQQKMMRHKSNLNRTKQNLSNELQQKQRSDLNSRNVITNGNLIQKQTRDLLEDTLRIGLETEQIGANTLNTLKEQRKKIQNIDHRVNDVDDNLNKANKHLKTMERRDRCVIF